MAARAVEAGLDTYADGRVDDTTLVYWLQTASAFADIRIPAQRPDLRDRGAVDRLDAVDCRALVEQGGVAGWTALDGDRCGWHRGIDFQPSTGVPDEGHLRREDGLLIETGVHEAYVEVWEPQPCGVGSIGAIELPLDDGRRQMLVVCGEVFLFARDRPQPLPPAPSLAVLLDRAGDRQAEIVDLLACELSFGRRGGDAAGWRIGRSTIPFREVTVAP
ncbi:MAG: hypothetical protein ABI629_08565 [bacterium]